MTSKHACRHGGPRAAHPQRQGAQEDVQDQGGGREDENDQHVCRRHVALHLGRRAHAAVLRLHVAGLARRRCSSLRLGLLKLAFGAVLRAVERRRRWLLGLDFARLERRRACLCGCVVAAARPLRSEGIGRALALLPRRRRRGIYAAAQPPLATQGSSAAAAHSGVCLWSRACVPALLLS